MNSPITISHVYSVQYKSIFIITGLVEEVTDDKNLPKRRNRNNR